MEERRKICPKCGCEMVKCVIPEVGWVCPRCDCPHLAEADEMLKESVKKLEKQFSQLL